MVTSHDSINACYCNLGLTDTLLTRALRLQAQFSSTNPAPTPVAVSSTGTSPNISSSDALFHPPGSDLYVSFRLETIKTSGLADNKNIGIGFFIYPDNTDGGGQGTNRVKFYNFDSTSEPSTNFPTGSGFVSQRTGTLTIPGADLTQSGSYKIILVSWYLPDQTIETDSNPPQMSRVVDGTGREDYYADTDDNVDVAGGVGAAPIFNVTVGSIRAAWIRVAANVQSLAPINPSDQQGYADTPEHSFDLGTCVNPKQVRAATMTPATATTSAGIDSKTHTVLTNGQPSTAQTYFIDRSYPTLVTNHVLRMYVGPSGGQSSTLLAEQPNLLNRGIAENIPTASDRAWICFVSSTIAGGLTYKNNYAIESASFQIGSGVKFCPTADPISQNVLTFDSPAYTTQRELFCRQPSAGSFLDNVYFECYAFDAFNTTINNISFLTEILRHTDDALEDSQTVVSDSNGRLRWNYQIASSDIAFNRFKKTTPDDPNSAPVTFTGSPLAGPHPAYGKHVKITGAQAGGSPQPTATTFSNAFGVNSEIHAGGIWTGGRADAAINANGAPTGAFSRSKILGSGNLRYKLCSALDVLTGQLVNDDASALTSVDGVELDASSNNIVQSIASFERNDNTVENSPASASVTLTTIDCYGTTPANGFELKESSGDGRDLNLCIGFSRSTTVRDSFVLSGDPENTVDGWDIGTVGNGNIGFTTDTNNYGYYVETVSFVENVPDLEILAASSKINVSPGESIKITAKCVKHFDNGVILEVLPDEALYIKICRTNENVGDALEIYVEDVMTAIDPVDGNSSDWEYIYTPDHDHMAYVITITGTVNGSRMQSGRTSFQAGVASSDFLLVAGAGDPSNEGTHWTLGSKIVVGAALSDGVNQIVVDENSGKLSVIRFDPATASLEGLGSDLTWSTILEGNPLYQFTMIHSPTNPNLLLLEFTAEQASFFAVDERTLYFLVNANSLGAIYTTSTFIDVMDGKNSHNRYTFDPTGNYK